MHLKVVHIPACFLRFAPFLFFLHFSAALSAQKRVTLRQAVAIADSHNLFLQALAYDIRLAKSEVITASTRLNPALNVQALQLLRPSAFRDGTNASSAYNRQLWYQFTKQFQTADKRHLKTLLAEAGIGTSEADIEEYKRNMALDVANSWLTMWLLKHNLKLIGSTKKNVDTLIHINKVRLRNEVITSTELIRTQVLADQYELAEKKLQQQLFRESLHLAFIMGISDSLDIQEEDLLGVEKRTFSLDSLIGISIASRTDIVQAAAALKVSKANVSLQKALATPNVEAGVLYNPQNSIPYGGLYLTVPIPFFDKNKGGVQKSTLDQDKSQQMLDALSARAANEIKIAYLAFETQKKNIVRSEDIFQKSRQVLNTVRYTYLKGNTTIIDYLEAQRSVYDTQTALNQALFDLNQSYIDLLYYAGLIHQSTY